MNRVGGPEVAKVGKKREGASNQNDFNRVGLLLHTKYLLNLKEVP